MAESDSFVVQENPIIGRCLIAKRNLQMGELLFQDAPVVQGPSRDQGELICFGCYNKIEDEDEEPECCDVCGLPVCYGTKSDCQMSSKHMPECQMISSCGGRSKTLNLLEDFAYLNETVLVLRALALKQTSPEQFEQLMKLESHLERRREDPDIETRVNRISDFIAQKLGLCSVELVEQICGILDINSFEVSYQNPNGSMSSIQCVYLTACLLEHNCVPNIHRSFEADLSIWVRAAKDISSHGHLTTTYTDSLWSTSYRRAHLYASKYFECLCSRCMDPTELQTHLSSVKCSKCPTGYLLSEDPIDPEVNWCCETCQFTASAKYIEDVNEQASQTVALLEQQADGASPEQCQKFLFIHSQILHPNHAIMTDIRHTLLHILGNCEGYLMADLNEDLLKLKEDCARTIIFISDKLIPGLSRLKGTTSYEMFLVFQQRALNWRSSGVRSSRDVLAAFNTAKMWLQQSLELLQYEPKHQAEGKLFERANGELQFLNEVINEFKE